MSDEQILSVKQAVDLLKEIENSEQGVCCPIESAKAREAFNIIKNSIFKLPEPQEE